jgi:uncharacterized protein YjbI with pentapeptide repeats
MKVCNFSGADLKGVNFENTDLSGASLSSYSFLIFIVFFLHRYLSFYPA